MDRIPGLQYRWPSLRTGVPVFIIEYWVSVRTVDWPRNLAVGFTRLPPPAQPVSCRGFVFKKKREIRYESKLTCNNTLSSYLVARRLSLGPGEID